MNRLTQAGGRRDMKALRQGDKSNAAVSDCRLVSTKALRMIVRRLRDGELVLTKKSHYLPNICLSLFFSSSSNSLN